MSLDPEMNLDPELAAVIADLPPGGLADPVAARRNMAALVELLRDADGGLRGDDRVEVTDRRVPGEPEVPVRVYRPVRTTGAADVVEAIGATGATGVLVYLHGGGFVTGSPDNEHPRCLRFAAEAGVAVVSVDYRLAPENPFPAGFDDCYAATVWAAGHAAELGADAAHVAVGGGSAGGGLAAAVALRARDEGGPAIAFQMLMYPVLDDRMDTPSMRTYTEPPLFNRADAELMWRHYLGDAPATSYAAPARAPDLSGLPPAYVLACEADPLRDEDILYAHRLIQSGVPTELHHVPGVYHGFDGITQTAVARRAFDRQLEVLRRAMP